MTSRPASAQHLRDLARLHRVGDRIDREYAQPLDVEALAGGAHMAAGHLSRQVRLAYGESPYSYLMTRRIERAMALLRCGGLSVTEVCFAVGCSSRGTFSTRFTELVIHSSFLPQDDPDAAVAFYRDILGFEVRLDVEYGGLHWITVGRPDQPGTSIVLHPPAVDPGITEKLQAGDAEVVQEPTEQPYGVRDCAVRDPAGNLIRIQELA